MSHGCHIADSDMILLTHKLHFIRIHLYVHAYLNQNALSIYNNNNKQYKKSERKKREHIFFIG